jgi:hypothetical protein
MRAAFLLALLLPELAQAQVRIEPAALDLGEVRGGRTIEAAFKLTNLGSAPVELVDLERSCGCVAPQWSERILKPGQHARLTVRVRTLGQSDGPRSWPLTLVTREAGEIAKQRLEIKAVMRNEIVLHPPQLALYVTQSLEQEIRLTDRRAQPLTITSWDAKMPGVRVEMLPSSPGTTRLKLSVDGSQIPPGRHDHVLHLYSNDRDYEHLEVPVALVRVAKPRATWTPESPEVILAPGQTKASVLIQIRGLAQPIDTIVGDDGLTCQWRADDDQAFVRVSLERGQFTGRGVQSAIRIRAGSESIAIPLIVRSE